MKIVLLWMLGTLSLTVLGIWFFGWGMWSMIESDMASDSKNMDNVETVNGYNYEEKVYEYNYDGLKKLVDYKMVKIKDCIENTKKLNNTERKMRECWECANNPSVWDYYNSSRQWILNLTQKFDLTDSDEKRIEEYVMNEVEKLPECEGYY